VETAADILDELGWQFKAASKVPAKSLISEPLLQRMDPGEPYGLDELTGIMGTDGARLLARLTELELAGLVSRVNGRFVRRP
jgi:predicted Rossmann fold nucleotide-binding protein DprA/Smf involved in DNA uptake